MNDNDLISRAALLKECAECQKTDPRFEERGWASHFLNDAGEPSTEWYCVEDMIENVPAVDAVPVVRCRDCKHRIVNKNAGKKGYMGLEAMCDLDTGDIFELGRNAEDPDWFCADGERRDDECQG